MTIITLMLCIILGMLYHFTAQNLERESLRMMQTVSATPLRPGQLDGPGAPPEEVHLPYFTVQLGRQNELIATGGGYYDLSDSEFLDKLINTVLSDGSQSGHLKEYKLRYSINPSPQGQSIVFIDSSSEETTLKNLVQTSLFIGVLSLVLFFLLSLLLAHLAVKPVEKAWSQQRQFVADASHELKTPLTVITTSAELLQSTDYDEASQKQFADSILVMSRQMRGLVEKLLDLARVDSGNSAAAFSQFDYSQLAADSLLPFEPLFFEKGLELHSSIEDGISLKGCESQLRQVIDILLDNAMKYSAPDGNIYVSLKKHGNYCQFSVSNPGEAISREDLKNIFKRFYRTDKARSINGSYGLGLSIAEGIVNSHRGKIWAESVNGIITFTVLLPL